MFSKIMFYDFLSLAPKYSINGVGMWLKGSSWLKGGGELPKKILRKHKTKANFIRTK